MRVVFMTIECKKPNNQFVLNEYKFIAPSLLLPMDAWSMVIRLRGATIEYPTPPLPPPPPYTTHRSVAPLSVLLVYRAHVTGGWSKRRQLRESLSEFSERFAENATLPASSIVQSMHSLPPTSPLRGDSPWVGRDYISYSKYARFSMF